jgi:hypothetical protein
VLSSGTNYKWTYTAYPDSVCTAEYGVESAQVALLPQVALQSIIVDVTITNAGGSGATWTFTGITLAGDGTGHNLAYKYNPGFGTTGNQSACWFKEIGLGTWPVPEGKSKINLTGDGAYNTPIGEYIIEPTVGTQTVSGSVITITQTP